MLMPKKVKFRKQQRGRRRGLATRGAKVSFGDYGLQALEVGWVTARQIEAARIAMTRHVKRGGKIWIRVFPDKPITKKPLETRMGKGKGAPDQWVCVVKPARILYEMEGVTREVAEDGVPRSPLEIVGKRCFRSLIDLTVERLPQMDESIRLREWERAQQHGVDNAEDRGVCSDAERQREYGDNGKARIFRELPKRVAKIV